MTVLTAIILGLTIGIAFGFMLEKSRAFEPGIVIGQMQLRNFILIKVWFSAIATALIGVTLLHEFGVITLHPQPVRLIADIAGGLLVGAGMTLAGGCPAMIMAQIGAGYRDAWFVVLGGIGGVAAFSMLEPLLRPLLTGGRGALTLVDLSATPFPALAVAIAVALFACIMALERLRPWRLDIGLHADGILHSHLRPPQSPGPDSSDSAFALDDALPPLKPKP
jgi:uncharacterized membrane protein YedE/YeeE